LAESAATETNKPAWYTCIVQTSSQQNLQTKYYDTDIQKQYINNTISGPN